MDSIIKDYIDKLGKVDGFVNATNQYSFSKKENEIRRNNLYLYFSELYKRKPSAILVGEAPGYQGGRLTGVPFMSEHILINGIDEIEMFGTERGFRKTDEYPDKIWKEPSATIVWGLLRQLKILPLLWASFPYHPHKGNPHTNRAPTAGELNIGRPFLKELIEIFSIEKIVAVGNKAHETLKVLGISAPKVRHPSHGGKNLFVSGVREFC